MKHSEEDDIVKGWKYYFHRMNERDVRSVSGDVEVEENDQTVGRLEGRTGVLKFTADEYTAWCLPWMNSLIIKVLGASFPTYIIRDHINRMWQPKDPLKIVPLSNGYYIVSFSNKEDREYAFQEGPWMIDDHYLINREHDRENDQSDRATSIYDKGGFARLCVEIDLKQLLIPSYTVFGEERTIIYEGLHHVCFQCGRYGHSKESCPMKQVEGKLNTQKPIEPEIMGSGGEQTMTGTEVASGSDKVQKGTAVASGGEKLAGSASHQSGDTSCILKASNVSKFKDSEVGLSHAAALVTPTVKEGVSDTFEQDQDAVLMEQVNMDEQMVEQDKTKGELCKVYLAPHSDLCQFCNSRRTLWENLSRLALTLQGACSTWNKDVFKHTELRKKCLLRRLDGINRVVARFGMVPKYAELQLSLWKDLEDVLLQESLL
ncbi:hypothetical protein K1719_026552 [Acacia pycnantha]|nr:hypothetical protein K1719_026552 [Acacia pycnantha]